MSNGNDDWGSGGQGGQPGQPQQPGQPGQANQGWGEQPSAPPQQPGMPQQPGPPQPQGAQQEPAWGQPPQQQAPEPDQWQNVGQQPQGNMVHQGSSGSNKLEQNDVIALIASFLLPGVGHMILGQTTRGIAILAAVLLTCGAGYIISLLVVADCYFVAMTQKYREVGDWELFPDYNDHI